MDMHRNDGRQSLSGQPDHPSGLTEVVDVNQIGTLSIHDGLKLAQSGGFARSEQLREFVHRNVTKRTGNSFPAHYDEPAARVGQCPDHLGHHDLRPSRGDQGVLNDEHLHDPSASRYA
jgi:hypothetical protein